MAERSKSQVVAFDDGMPKVSCKDGVLKTCGHLHRADVMAFEAACDELMASPQKDLEFDLTQCTYLSSRLVGELVETVMQLKTQGNTVRVYVSPEIGRLLQMAHLYHLFTYEVREPISVAEAF